MSHLYVEGETFEKNNYTVNHLPKGDYENCIFIQCDFSGSNLSGVNFIACTFTDCNLSLSKINQTSFREVTFKQSKLLGLHFNHCNDFLFDVNFENCTLNLCSFYQLKMKKTVFLQCEMNEVDFTETDISQALMDECDLTGSIFENTILEKADLRGAHHFCIDPEKNKIKKMKVSRHALSGFLEKYDLQIE